MDRYRKAEIMKAAEDRAQAKLEHTSTGGPEPELVHFQGNRAQRLAKRSEHRRLMKKVRKAWQANKARKS